MKSLYFVGSRPKVTNTTNTRIVSQAHNENKDCLDNRVEANPQNPNPRLILSSLFPLKARRKTTKRLKPNPAACLLCGSRKTAKHRQLRSESHSMQPRHRAENSSENERENMQKKIGRNKKCATSLYDTTIESKVENGINHQPGHEAGRQ